MSTEQFSNNAGTTLSAGCAAGDATISVVSAATFPASGQFRILVDNEIMLVTAVSGATFTVTRGAEGSATASHLNGASVVHILTAGALAQFVADNVQRGSFGSRPAAAKAGRIYVPSYALADNSPLLERDNGGGWDLYGPAWNMQPPDDSGFSWINQNGSSTIQAANKGPVILQSGAVGALAPSCRVKAIPAAPFDLVMCMSAAWLGNSEAGLVLADNANKLVTLRMLGPSGGNNVWAGNWTSPTVFNSNVSGSQVGYSFLGAPLIWLRFQDDNANWNLMCSLDGQNWLTVCSVARNTFATATKYGYYVATASGSPVQLMVWHFTP